MITKEQYLLDPCSSSSLAFWKTNAIKTNKKITLVDKAIANSKSMYFFKLIHNLCHIDMVQLDDKFEYASISDLDYVNHINSCYEKVGVSLEELQQYKKRKTYNENLWLAIKNKTNGAVIATAIAEFDNEIKEGVIEWVQVSKEYRRCGLGSMLVNELLTRLKPMATFVTVCGDCNNKSNPMKLYQKCGFSNMKIWCISDYNL